MRREDESETDSLNRVENHDINILVNDWCSPELFVTRETRKVMN